MIPVEQALALIVQASSPLKSIELPLEKASGFVLAGFVKAPGDSPPFHQSAMDGYAIRFADLAKYESLQCDEEVAAGKFATGKLKAGKAIRIFTGASVTKGADTVVMQENVTRDGNHITIINKDAVKPGANIRLRGSQIRKGAVALPVGALLTPASIGFLATMGIAKIPVTPKPVVSIVATGNELQTPGKLMQPGQIYESNSYTLQALLREMQIPMLKPVRVRDNARSLETAFGKALQQSDVLLITGGISVGDYDLVEPVLKKMGVKKVFHKVAQKPGKPFYFGTRGRKLIFALPGNPASVLTCFYEYVELALRRLGGSEQIYHATQLRVINNNYSKKTGLTHFLKAIANETHVDVLHGQESYLLNSFAGANCLVVIPADSQGVQAGETVSVHFLNQRRYA